MVKQRFEHTFKSCLRNQQGLIIGSMEEYGWEIVSVIYQPMEIDIYFKRPIMDSVIPNFNHSDIKDLIIEVQKTMDYMHSVITEIPESELETYSNLFANTMMRLAETKASL